MEDVVDLSDGESLPPAKRGKLAVEFDELLHRVQDLSDEQQDSLLKELLADDLLKDLPENPSSQFVDSLVKIETGQAFTISIIKVDGTPIRSSS
jgi:hypothetical protein